MIFRILGKILLGLLILILVLLIIICLSSVTINLSFWDKKFDWSIRYFGLQILPRKKKSDQGEQPSETKSDKKKKSDSKKDDKQEQDEEKQQFLLMDKIWKKFQKFVRTMDMAGNAVYALPKTMRCLVKSIRLCQLRTDFIIADEDAEACARQYGLMQTALQNLVTFTGLRKREISVRCDFTMDESIYQFSTKINVHIGKLVITGLVFVIEYLKNSHNAKKAIVNKKI